MQNQFLLQKAYGIVTCYGEHAIQKTNDKHLLTIIQDLLKERDEIKNSASPIPVVPKELWF